MNIFICSLIFLQANINWCPILATFRENVFKIICVCFKILFLMTNQSIFSTFKHNIFLSVIKILANAQCWMFLDYNLTKNKDQFTLKHCKGISDQDHFWFSCWLIQIEDSSDFNPCFLWPEVHTECQNTFYWKMKIPQYELVFSADYFSTSKLGLNVHTATNTCIVHVPLTN